MEGPPIDRAWSRTGCNRVKWGRRGGGIRFPWPSEGQEWPRTSEDCLEHIKVHRKIDNIVAAVWNIYIPAESNRQEESSTILEYVRRDIQRIDCGLSVLIMGDLNCHFVEFDGRKYNNGMMMR